MLRILKSAPWAKAGRGRAARPFRSSPEDAPDLTSVPADATHVFVTAAVAESVAAQKRRHTPSTGPDATGVSRPRRVVRQPS